MGASRTVNSHPVAGQVQRLRTQLTLPTREVLAWVLGRRHRFTVRGGSMLPLLREGEDILIRRLRAADQLAVGELVLAQHPSKPDFWLVKQVAGIIDNGARYMLEGLNPVASTDSRHFGSISRQMIAGRVTAILG
jgi:nickel-type superoxide dismutase maturation protease